MTVHPSHLDFLESEAIYIFREAAAQFRKPVLLYSIGKDSTVLLHLARKAFWPQKLPFPLLHIDTGWKPRDMIAFRDRTVNELGLELIVHMNAKGLADNINPIDHAPSLYTDVMKTQAHCLVATLHKIVHLNASMPYFLMALWKSLQYILPDLTWAKCTDCLFGKVTPVIPMYRLPLTLLVAM